jgi:hypothetical protein
MEVKICFRVIFDMNWEAFRWFSQFLGKSSFFFALRSKFIIYRVNIVPKFSNRIQREIDSNVRIATQELLLASSIQRIKNKPFQTNYRAPCRAFAISFSRPCFVWGCISARICFRSLSWQKRQRLSCTSRIAAFAQSISQSSSVTPLRS